MSGIRFVNLRVSCMYTSKSNSLLYECVATASNVLKVCCKFRSRPAIEQLMRSPRVSVGDILRIAVAKKKIQL